MAVFVNIVPTVDYDRFICSANGIYLFSHFIGHYAVFELVCNNYNISLFCGFAKIFYNKLFGFFINRSIVIKIKSRVFIHRVGNTFAHRLAIGICEPPGRSNDKAGVKSVISENIGHKHPAPVVPDQGNGNNSGGP